MRNVDLTHLWRSTVGFDRLLDLFEDQIRWTDEDNYPPYDIERVGENRYQISLALAGFTPEEITVTAEQDLLTVQGRKSAKDDHEYLLPGDLSTSVPARVQLGGLRQSRDRDVCKRIAEDRAGPGNS
jgi:molecular chaperone IbpA